MPVNKNGKQYYTDEQYQAARYEASALEYARAEGYSLVRRGKYYAMQEHDSFVFAPNGMWFWNSHDMKGGAIEFLTQVEHRSLVEAVLTLSGEQKRDQSPRQIHESLTSPYMLKDKSMEEKKPFELPPKADNFKRLFAYLCGARGLDRGIVQELVHDRKLYEGVAEFKDKATGQIQYLHNAVFVSYDQDGIAQNGFLRGLSTKSYFKGEIESSNKLFPFVMQGYPNSDTVAIFEAPIDAVSQATIEKLNGQDYRSIDRLAGGGNTPVETYLNYLKQNPNIKNMLICTDNDEAGNVFAEKLKNALHENSFTADGGFHIFRKCPAEGKDFNNQLMSIRKDLSEREVSAKTPQVDEPPDRGCDEDGFFPQLDEDEEECEP